MDEAEILRLEKAERRTFDAIVARCKGLTPPIDIKKHIKSGTLKAANNTLDGIKFEPVDAKALIAEFGGRMKKDKHKHDPTPPIGPVEFDHTRHQRPRGASMTSMQEEPDNWALEASFGATEGVGFREKWRPPPIMLAPPLPNYSNPRLSLGFGEAGKKLNFTSLHASVRALQASIHIDERGFVVDLPGGAGSIVNPSFWSHVANELLLKTIFRDWLDGVTPDNLVGKLVVEAVNRVSLRFPDVENQFAGLKGKVDKINTKGGTRGVAEGIGKTLLPIGVSADFFRLDNSTIQGNVFWNDGQTTFTLSWGGKFGGPI
jgi:hypothetical protein